MQESAQCMAPQATAQVTDNSSPSGYNVQSLFDPARLSPGRFLMLVPTHRRFVTSTAATYDALYLVDSHPIELRDLGLGHPILRQSADATELGGRYPAVLAPDRRRSPCLLRFRSRFDL